MTRRKRWRTTLGIGAMTAAVAHACTAEGPLDYHPSGLGGAVGQDVSTDATDSGNAQETQWIDASCFGSCTLPNAATTECINTKCVIVSCVTSFGDCDGIAETGCETSLLGDDAHCGSCTTACQPLAPEKCVAGACVGNCPTGQVDCNGATAGGCALLAWDGAHCGSCGNGCGTGMACRNGQCVTSACAVGQGTLVLRPTSDIESGLWAASPDKPYWDKVDEALPDDGATTYIWDDTQVSPSRVTFDHAPPQIPSGRSIAQLIASGRVRRAATATADTQVWFHVKIGSSYTEGQKLAVQSSSFVSISQKWPTSPSGQPWTATELATLGFGITHQKPVSSTAPVDVTQIELEVCLEP